MTLAQLRTLQRQQQRLNDPAYVEQLARDRLHFCMTGQTCYVIIGGPGSGSAAGGTGRGHALVRAAVALGAAGGRQRDGQAGRGWVAAVTDEAVVERQLGRPPRALRRVAHRCPCGLPDVVETAPRLPDGTPFPTLYYLTCPRAVAAVSRLEAAGAMRLMQRAARG